MGKPSSPAAPPGGTSAASSASLGLRSRRQARDHLRANLLSRHELYRPGVNFVQTAFYLGAPGRFDFGLRLEILFDEKAFNKPIHFLGRQLANFFENFLGAAARGEIVARNRFQMPGRSI
jgi:hypothetical protein